MSPTLIHIAILECDTPSEPILSRHGTYGTMFSRLLSAAASTISPSPQLHFTVHDALASHPSFPPLTPPSAAPNAILITGSRHNAFESLPWIENLVAYTAAALAPRSKTKIIGVCFGHQIVGRAIGLPVARSDKGWELAVTPIELGEAGKGVFGRDVLRLHQMHRDVVAPAPTHDAEPRPAPDPSAPAGRKGVEPVTAADGDGGGDAQIVQLGETPLCSTQGMLLPGRALTVQGHPEFTGDIVRALLETRLEQGIIGDDVFADAMARVDDEHDGALVARAFVEFLLEGPRVQA